MGRIKRNRLIAAFWSALSLGVATAGWLSATQFPTFRMLFAPITLPFWHLLVATLILPVCAIAWWYAIAAVLTTEDALAARRAGRPASPDPAVGRVPDLGVCSAVPCAHAGWARNWCSLNRDLGF
jgi:hypothetical protein